MIRKIGEIIKIDALSSTLVIKETTDNPEILYFGKKIEDATGLSVCSIIKRNKCFASADNYSAYNTLFSFFGDGNDGEPFLKIINGNGNFTEKFVYDGCSVDSYFFPTDILPAARNGDETLTLRFKDKDHSISVNLYISTFSDSGALAFSSEVINNGENTIYADRLSSVQIEYDGEKSEVVTFDGAWARECHKHSTEISCGIFRTDSKSGASSNKHNPFVAVKNVENGRWTAFNPVWSGNHGFTLDVSPLGFTRILSGMNDFMSHYPLEKGQKLCSPQTIVANGGSFEEISDIMREFVIKHIIPERFARLERPIVLNNWEATYFNFDRIKLEKLIDRAKSAGVELFVLDDGWFGKRDDDRSGLGDWVDNEKKTGGLDTLAQYARRVGMKFGLWVEPEMISTDSDLYRAHPEYAMRLPESQPLEKRYQLMLDLCNEEVADYLIDALSKTFNKCRPSYVKWDFNRTMTDVYGLNTYYGKYFYDYVVSLYRIIKTLTEKYPETIFEGCASGGNRFDLGILCYMPQIWTSDDTDARERVDIQAGTLAAYPQSAMSAHVSASPNHQTGNETPLRERFIVASRGAFGYELDLEKLSKDELAEISRQIAYYKEHRRLLQFGNCKVLENSDLRCVTITYDKESGEGSVAVINKKQLINRIKPKIRLSGFEDKAIYEISVYGEDDKFTVCGEVLNNCPLDLDYLAKRNSVNSISAFLLYIKKI